MAQVDTVSGQAILEHLRKMIELPTGIKKLVLTVECGKVLIECHYSAKLKPPVDED